MKRRNERGASIVEFALIAPILFLCIFGMIDLGRMFLVQAMVTNGAREGARMAALGYSTAEIEARVNTSMPSLDAISQGTHTITPSAACPTVLTATSARTVEVRVVNFRWLALGAVSGLFPGGGIPTPNPRATSEMRCLG